MNQYRKNRTFECVLTNYGLGLIVNTNGSRRIRKPLFVSKTITETTRRRQAVEGVEKERLPVRGSSKSLENLVNSFLASTKLILRPKLECQQIVCSWWNRLLWVFWAFLSYVFNMCIVALANNRQKFNTIS